MNNSTEDGGCRQDTAVSVPRQTPQILKRVCGVFMSRRRDIYQQTIVDVIPLGHAEEGAEAVADCTGTVRLELVAE